MTRTIYVWPSVRIMATAQRGRGSWSRRTPRATSTTSSASSSPAGVPGGRPGGRHWHGAAAQRTSRTSFPGTTPVRGQGCRVELGRFPLRDEHIYFDLCRRNPAAVGTASMPCISRFSPTWTSTSSPALYGAQGRRKRSQGTSHIHGGARRHRHHQAPHPGAGKSTWSTPTFVKASSKAAISENEVSLMLDDVSFRNVPEANPH